MYVLNKSKGKTEKAIEDECPSCKGFGRNFGEEECPICNGYGTLWIAISGSGWTRPLFCLLEKSQLY